MYTSCIALLPMNPERYARKPRARRCYGPFSPRCRHLTGSLMYEGCTMVVDTKMVKSVGEHWVCSELARRGWAPALTRDGLSRTDILAVGVNRPDRPQIEVQVKVATQVRTTSWELGNAINQLALSDREWFVL